MGYEKIRVRPVSAALGAEIGGVDLAALNDDTWREIHRAFLRHQVIFFRDQRITPEQQIAISRRFGAIGSWN